MTRWQGRTIEIGLGPLASADGAHGFRQGDFRGERAVTRRLT
jgi:hypothetical protein